MVIAFYPGAGGNRFYQSLTNPDCSFDLNKIYDYDNPYQYYPNRYPGRIEGHVDSPVIFTHCMNYELITKTWPNHTQGYMLEIDFYKSLKRQWYLVENKINSNSHPAGGPFSAIAWHNDYYTQYPPDAGDLVRVNESTFPDFYLMIQQELDSIICPEFDFAKEMFLTHGKTAPILDLYRELYEQK